MLKSSKLSKTKNRREFECYVLVGGGGGEGGVEGVVECAKTAE